MGMHNGAVQFIASQKIMGSQRWVCVGNMQDDVENTPECLLLVALGGATPLGRGAYHDGTNIWDIYNTYKQEPAPQPSLVEFGACRKSATCVILHAK